MQGKPSNAMLTTVWSVGIIDIEEVLPIILKQSVQIKVKNEKFNKDMFLKINKGFALGLFYPTILSLSLFCFLRKQITFFVTIFFFNVFAIC